MQSPPYLRGGPLPWRTALIRLGLQGSGMMGFPKTLRLDLKTEFSTLGMDFGGFWAGFRGFPWIFCDQNWSKSFPRCPHN